MNKQKQGRVKRIRIDSIHGGVGNPPFDIENNTLTSTTLYLKASDLN
jgi:hypothetical protein